MPDDFAAFADSLAASEAVPVIKPVMPERVAVLGAGADGRLLACLCAAEGADVTLFSHLGRELAAIRKSGGITLRGTGPVGTFQVGKGASSVIRLSSELDSAVENADLIILAGPVLRQRAAIYALGQFLRDGQVLALVPGRTFGALEANWILRANGCGADVVLLETQGTPYWIHEAGHVLHLATADSGAMASLPGGRQDAMGGLAMILPDAKPALNVVHSSFADGSSVVELPTLLLGGPAAPSGARPIPAGAEPLAERATFRSLPGRSHLRVVELLAEERRRVAARWGVRDLPDVDLWLESHAGTAFGERARPIPDAQQADHLVRCAIVGSLVPLLSAAKIASVDIPVSRAMAAIADAALGGGLVQTGRRLEAVGIRADDIDRARLVMDSIAAGHR